MATITFETLSFRIVDTDLEVTLLKNYATKIPLEELHKIAPFARENLNTISFTNITQEKAQTKFMFLFEKHLDQLKTKITGNPCTYIHQNSGIPLIGNVAFGIVYRNSSIIEIKTNNGCNLDCVYCSIGEGLSSTKHDFVIEKEYLIQELQTLLEFVDEPVEIHIGVQGEPFLYGDMENLIADLQSIQQVHTISIDTNGTLLNKEIINRLAKNTKLQLNLSLDAISDDIAKQVAGTKSYSASHIKDVIAYASEKLNVIVAPVLTQGYNEHEMEKIIQWIQTLKHQPTLGIQNFLPYKTGRNPAKELPWEKFYALLDKWETQYNIKLRLSKDDFHIKKTKDLPKPFYEGDIITAVVKAPGRFPHEVLAVAKDRTIAVPMCDYKKEKKIKIKITRDKHNIFAGMLVK